MTILEKRELCAAGIFLAFSLLYFLPVPIPHKIVFPLLVLSVFSAGRLPWQMCLAFVFSCIGDLSGSFKPTHGQIAFIGQMAGFAIAHIFFIIFFLSWGLKQKKAMAGALKKASKNKKNEMLKGQGLYFALVLALVLIALQIVFTRVVPCVPPGVLQTGVSVYASIICIMLFCSLMTSDWIWGLGSALFVLSDFILAWNMFVSPVPASKYFILVPYFGAQLILFLRTAYNCNKTNR